MLIDNISIAIVGGGPAGLTLARLLQLKNAYVKVYERDFNKEARVQGSPLDMHENSGLAAISKADLLEEFKKTFRPGADKTLIMNEQAEILFSDHDTKPDEDFGASSTMMVRSRLKPRGSSSKALMALITMFSSRCNNNAGSVSIV